MAAPAFVSCGARAIGGMLAAMTTTRPIAQTDYDQWRPLWDGYNKFYGRDGATALPEEITQQTWRRFFDGAEPVHALVAEREGRIVGIVHFLFHRSTTLANDICYLQDLFTDAAARGGGIGRALIEAVYATARAAGSERVYWQTHETNAQAMVLYNAVAERSGFLVYRKAL
jgi:GNAT superfamily N-acetyltransferase